MSVNQRFTTSVSYTTDSWSTSGWWVNDKENPKLGKWIFPLAIGVDGDFSRIFERIMAYKDSATNLNLSCKF